MKTYIDILKDNYIEYYAMLPFSECRVMRPYLYEREAGFLPQSVLVFCVPYYNGKPKNMSAYAAGYDYHRFMKTLLASLISSWQESYPQNRFLGFSDHSPIDERHAAARAGLGVMGKNGLLITEKYSSYVFIGEVLTDLAPSFFKMSPLGPALRCADCGLCCSACPTKALTDGDAACLSAITQKKGALTPDEEAVLRQNGSIWGCDRCQEVCPYTKKALHAGSIYTPIPYFQMGTLSCLTAALLDNMPDEEFSRRAFSWRGKELLYRNLSLCSDQDT